MYQVKFEGEGRVHRIKNSITLKELELQIQRIASHHFPVELVNVREQRDNEDYRLNSISTKYIGIEIEQAWTVGVRIYLNNRPDWNQKIKDDTQGRKQIPVNWQPEINWSGSGRSLAAAVACVNLYQQAVAFVSEFISWSSCSYDFIEHLKEEED